MKSRRQRTRRNRRKTRRGGSQYLSNVGWSTGYQTLPTSYLYGNDSALAASPGMFARTTTNWV
jgi:hypothetical protein